MNAAWKWIKGIGLAILLTTIFVQAYKLSMSEAEKATLSQRLSKAQMDNQTNLTTINILKEQAAEHNALMVKRQQERNKREAALRDDIAQIKTQMVGIECRIPDGVAERLREPY